MPGTIIPPCRNIYSAHLIKPTLLCKNCVLPSISIISSFKIGQALENHGEALWRKLVERKMMTGEEEKKKPLFKFNPNFKKKNGLSNGSIESPLEQMEALKKNLEDRTR